MKRARTIFVASNLIALAAVSVGYGSSSAEQRAPSGLDGSDRAALVGKRAPSGAPTGSDSAARMAAHRGGTLKLLAKAAGGTLDPQVNYTLQYWQLYQATYDGLLGFKKAGGDAAFKVVPDLATSLPTPTNGGKTWVFTLRKGIKFSNGKTVTPARRGRVVPAHLQGEEPDLRHVLRGHRRREGVPREAGDLHAEGRREREREAPGP